MSVRTKRLLAVAAAGLTLVLLASTPATAGSGQGGAFRPGAPGVGDPYYPGYGNGGYDVAHYDLDIKYVPATDQLTGHAVIRAKATQNLSRFNLDFVGLTVDGIWVDGRRATWSRSGQELSVTPARKLPQGPDLHRRGQLPRRPADVHHPGDAVPGRVHAHRRRRRRRWPARGGGLVVSGQRPPAGQGELHVRGHRAGRPRGALQRHSAGQPHRQRLDHLEVGAAHADDQLSGHRDDR